MPRAARSWRPKASDRRVSNVVCRTPDRVPSESEPGVCRVKGFRMHAGYVAVAYGTTSIEAFEQHSMLEIRALP